MTLAMNNSMHLSKSEERLLRLAAPGRFQQGHRWEWLMWLNVGLLSIGVAVKVAGEPTSLNIVMGVMVVSFFSLIILLVRFKCRALALIQKLQIMSQHVDGPTASTPC